MSSSFRSGQTVAYKYGQLLSVTKQHAYVLIEGDDQPTKVRIADYVELGEGVRDISACDWDTDNESEVGDDTLTDGGENVELRNTGGEWKVHRINGKKMRTFTYSIPDITNDAQLPKHHDKKLTVHWAFLALDDNCGEEVRFQITAGENKTPAGIPASIFGVGKDKRNQAVRDFLENCDFSSGSWSKNGEVFGKAKNEDAPIRRYPLGSGTETILSHAVEAGMRLSTRKKVSKLKAIGPAKNLRVVITDPGDVDGGASCTIGYTV